MRKEQKKATTKVMEKRKVEILIASNENVWYNQLVDDESRLTNEKRRGGILVSL